MNLQVLGLTRYNLKTGTMKISFRYHTNYEELLDTIAHEFAHVYLNFTNPQHKHDKEHTKQKNYFLKYLKAN